MSKQLKSVVCWVIFISYVLLVIVFLLSCLLGRFVVSNSSVGLLGISGILVSIIFGEVIFKNNKSGKNVDKIEGI